MKRTIRLTESELTKMISDCVKTSISTNRKKSLKEGIHRYKGFKCINISKDPSFPSYQVISPDGEAIGSTLFPSEMKTMVDDYLAGNNWEEKVYQKLSESVGYDNKSSIKHTIEENEMKRNFVKLVSEEVIRRLNEDEDSTDMKRNAIMKALKDPKYNHAQLAYALWPHMDKDTSRSLFSKMANGTPDNDGVIRQFSEKDINSLYQMIRKK